MDKRSEPDVAVVYEALRRAVELFYEFGPRLIALSVLWFVCSIPVVTVGPATLGVYSAVCSLREHDAIRRREVFDVVKRHFVTSVLLSGLPVTFGAIAVLYVRRYLRSPSTLALVFGILSVYVCAYLLLVLIPAYLELANGTEPASAVAFGMGWVAREPLAAIMMGLVSVILFVVTAALTIAFPLTFAGLTLAFHAEAVAAFEEPDHFPLAGYDGE